MSIIDDLLTDARESMDKSVEATQGKFGTVRAGRASPTMLDRVMVDYYGASTPLKQLASINAPEARLLTVQPFDKGSLKAIERGIVESDVGLTPNNDGQLIRLVLPEMTQERRKEMVKVAHKYTEEARVAVRHVRRDGLDHLKKLLKDSAISEDDEKRQAADVQKATDQYIAEIDGVLASKEKEIMQV